MTSKKNISRYSWAPVLAALLGLNFLFGLMPFRWDLTKEKRYTLSQPVRKMLGSLSEPVEVTVFLEGAMPAGFQKLQNSTQETLQDFKQAAKGNLRFRFEKAGTGLTEEAKTAYLDTLAMLGIKPYTIQAQVKEGEGEEQRQVVPGALVSYKGRKVGVNLLSGQSSTLDESSINRTEALLEYKLAEAIRNLTTDTVPMIGYLIGNGQPMNYQVYSLIESLKQQYAFRFFPIDSFPFIPTAFSAMLVVKPTIGFTNDQKLKLDQYVMHGGKLLWLVDNLYAEMDSLQRTQKDFIAFDRGLNVEDLLFKYGVRINQDLLQDLNCDKIPSVVGMVGDKPQMQLLPWPYFPLLSSYSQHPIAKNLDYVLAQFPNSIDTVQAAGIQKTILLASSSEARSLKTPARVSWNSIQSEDDLKTFNKSNLPVAVLLEGSFSSLYANRLSTEQRMALQSAGEAFKTQSPPNKMIVVSDADIALNPVSQTDGPLQVGMNPYTRYQYANKDFLFNAVAYLVDGSGILEARSKDFTLRLLDKKKVAENRTFWQSINVILPVVMVALFGLLYQYLRSRKYGVKKG